MISLTNKHAAITLSKDADNILHRINDFVIHEYNNSIKLINTRTYKITFYETEQEAIDFLLDFYKGTNQGEQLSFI
jgi:hypothetical protein